MKQTLLLFFALSINTFGQTTCFDNSNKIQRIITLDAHIHKIDTYNSYTKDSIKRDNTLRAMENYGDAKKQREDSLAQLIKVSEIFNCEIEPVCLRYYLQCILHYSSLKLFCDKVQNTFEDMENEHSKGEQGKANYYCIEKLRENITILNLLLHQKTERNFFQYRNDNYKPHLIKGGIIYHDNDFIFATNNSDRDYTGGARIVLFTDYLKFNLLNSAINMVTEVWNNYRVKNGKSLLFEDNNFNTYQSIFYGAEAYTPQLRNRGVFTTLTSVDSLDRPYASFQYIGLGKYFIRRRGDIRVQEETKFGKIGGKTTDVVQSVLHRDLITNSLVPYGWESQIAPNGRYGIQYDFLHEMALISPDNVFRHLLHTSFNWGKLVNFYSIVEGRAGCEMTSAALGLGYTTVPFKNQNGTFIKKRGTLKDKGGEYNKANGIRYLLDIKLMYRYMLYSSLLQGFGYIKPMTDDDPTTKEIYVLSNSEVEHFYWLGSISFSLAKGRTALFGRVSFIGDEVSPSKTHYYNDKDYLTYSDGETDHKSYQRKLHKNTWGTLGVQFLLGE